MCGRMIYLAFSSVRPDLWLPCMLRSRKGDTCIGMKRPSYQRRLGRSILTLQMCGRMIYLVFSSVLPELWSPRMPHSENCICVEEWYILFFFELVRKLWIISFLLICTLWGNFLCFKNLFEHSLPIFINYGNFIIQRSFNAWCKLFYFSFLISTIYEEWK